MKHRVPVLTIYELIEPVEDARLTVHRVQARLDAVPPLDGMSLAGHFVLMMASFETMFGEIMRRYWYEHPDELPKAIVEIDRTELAHAATTKDLLVKIVDRNIQSIMYGSFADILQRFFAVLRLPRFPDSTIIAALTRAKTTRNRILHGSVAIHRPELSTVIAASANIAAVLEHIERELRKKYGDRTRVAVYRSIWEHVFQTPLMPFSQFWNVDEVEDRILNPIIRDSPGGMASSEWRYYQLWLANWKGRDDHLVMRSLGSTDKLVWFLDVLRAISPGGTFGT